MDPTDRPTFTSSRRRAPARRLRSSLAVVALAAATAQLALASTASACNEYVYERRVAAVAPTGAIVEVVASESGAGREGEVAVIGADGRELARCTQEYDEPWTCRGDRRFRARGTERAARIVARWSTALGASPAPAPVPVPDAPVGVLRALCSREEPVYLATQPYDCRSNAAVVTVPGSPLVFARFDTGEQYDCGATSSYDAMLGLSRAQLAERLARRERVFTRRGRPALAEEARAGQAWLATLAP